ncbi:8408_t:CDS:1, partial [Gigaspora margarita]
TQLNKSNNQSFCNRSLSLYGIPSVACVENSDIVNDGLMAELSIP